MREQATELKDLVQCIDQTLVDWLIELLSRLQVKEEKANLYGPKQTSTAKKKICALLIYFFYFLGI